MRYARALADPPDTEALYRHGVERWQARDLAGAVASFEDATGGGPDLHDNWWFAATRALAQVAMEQGEFERAERHLQRLPGTAIGDALTIALRARLMRLVGDDHAAQVEVSIAVHRLADGAGADDAGSLMNGAIALMWSAEVLVELGYWRQAVDLVGRARMRTAAAGIHDPVIVAVLTLIEALAARLRSDAEEAARLLGEVDTSTSGDVEIQLIREKARLAWDAGDRGAASRLYRDALVRCESMGYVTLRHSILTEHQAGPPRAQSVAEAVEQWAEQELLRQLAEHRRYAVVVSLAVDADPDRFLELEARVRRLLSDSPDLGTIDGAGTDGGSWELYLEGDDPEALWAAVRPLVVALGPAPGSSVTIRRNSHTETKGLVL